MRQTVLHGLYFAGCAAAARNHGDRRAANAAGHLGGRGRTLRTYVGGDGRILMEFGRGELRVEARKFALIMNMYTL